MKIGLIHIFNKFKNSNFYFLLIFLYQILFIFQGIDFCDEGFYGVFYQQIFKDPQSVQYNFMYWFSGIIGGAYLNLFPQFGLLALRFAGVLIQTTTIFIVFNGLKKYANPFYLKLGLLLATVLISFDPKSIFYDNLSSLFFVSASLILFQGLNKGQLSKFFISGVLISLNTFTRLPNILGIGLFVIILYDGFLNKRKFNYQIKQVLLFLTGFAVTTLLIILIMKLVGHYSVFIDCIKLVSEMGRSSENTHGIKKLLTLFLWEYSHSVFFAIVFLTLIITIGSSLRRVEKKNNYFNTIRLLAYFLTFLCLVFAIKSFLISWYWLLSLVTGLSIMAGFFLNIDKTQTSNTKILSFLGIMMVLVQPLGSDFGLYSMGRYSLWLALPIAINYYFSLVSISKNTLINSIGGNFLKSLLFPFQLQNPVLMLLRNWVFITLLILFMLYGLTETWYDSRNRTKMVYEVNNNFMRGIFTTKNKAKDINELLQESKKYVKKNDYVLAYDKIPLYYPMTDTKPFIRNSWPMLFDRSTFKKSMEIAVAEKKIFPVIIYQKANTLGKREWPDLNNKDLDIDQPRNSYIKDFIKKNQYKIVWENTSFRIFISSK